VCDHVVLAQQSCLIGTESSVEFVHPKVFHLQFFQIWRAHRAHRVGRIVEVKAQNIPLVLAPFIITRWYTLDLSPQCPLIFLGSIHLPANFCERMTNLVNANGDLVLVDLKQFFIGFGAKRQ
jgi:hypothetical protein